MVIAIAACSQVTRNSTADGRNYKLLHDRENPCWNYRVHGKHPIHPKSPQHHTFHTLWLLFLFPQHNSTTAENHHHPSDMSVNPVPSQGESEGRTTPSHR